MDKSTTRPPSATRSIETTQGILTCAQLAPLLAERVLEIEGRIAAGAYAGMPSLEQLALDIHRELAFSLVPAWAGKWRLSQVVVGTHTPPPSHEVPILMRQYADDIAMHLEHVSESENLLLETLAYAEGRFLSIHPFLDFNGRVIRLMLSELLFRLNLPSVALFASPDSEEEQAYFKALRAADRNDWSALIDVWKKRFEHVRFPQKSFQ